MIRDAYDISEITDVIGRVNMTINSTSKIDMMPVVFGSAGAIRKAIKYFSESFQPSPMSDPEFTTLPNGNVLRGSLFGTAYVVFPDRTIEELEWLTDDILFVGASDKELSCVHPFYGVYSIDLTSVMSCDKSGFESYLARLTKEDG